MEGVGGKSASQEKYMHESQKKKKKKVKKRELEEIGRKIGTRGSSPGERERGNCWLESHSTVSPLSRPAI
jgi:hypothetical protein